MSVQVTYEERTNSLLFTIATEAANAAANDTTIADLCQLVDGRDYKIDSTVPIPV